MDSHLNTVIQEKFKNVEEQNKSFRKGSLLFFCLSFFILSEISNLKSQLSSEDMPDVPLAFDGDEDTVFLRQRLEASENLVDDLRTSLEDLESKHENLLDDLDDLKHQYKDCKEEKLFLEDERRRLGDLFGINNTNGNFLNLIRPTSYS